MSTDLHLSDTRCSATPRRSRRVVCDDAIRPSQPRIIQHSPVLPSPDKPWQHHGRARLKDAVPLAHRPSADHAIAVLLRRRASTVPAALSEASRVLRAVAIVHQDLAVRLVFQEAAEECVLAWVYKPKSGRSKHTTFGLPCCSNVPNACFQLYSLFLVASADRSVLFLRRGCGNLHSCHVASILGKNGGATSAVLECLQEYFGCLGTL